MPIVVVGGSGRNVGKTSVICGLIAALPEFRWTAVKITSHRHGMAEPVWEERAAGQQTDTARYLAAGAKRALLVTLSVTAHDGRIPMDAMNAALGEDRDVIFESNSIIDYVQPDVSIGVIGEQQAEMKPSFERFLSRAHALVASSESAPEVAGLEPGTRVFAVADLSRPSPDLVNWLRSRW